LSAQAIFVSVYNAKQDFILRIILFFYLLLISFRINAQQVKVDGSRPYLFHSVEGKEELHDIALRYGVAIPALKKANNLNNNNIDSLEQVRVPFPIQRAKTQIHPGKFVFHKVTEDEKLHTIADFYKISLAELRRANKLKSNKLDPGSYVIIPNTFKHIMHKNKLVVRGFLSLGFFSGTDWAGESSTNYHIRGQFNLQNTYEKKWLRMLSYVNTSIGYRHELGKYFFKNVDQFSLKQQVELKIKNGFALYALGSVRSQQFDNYRYINEVKELTSSFMAPGYVNYSAGLTYSNDYLLLDFGLYEMRSVYVLQDKVYKERESAFGVLRGDKFFGIHGFSLRADLDLYNSEKFNTNASFFGFYNKDIITLDFRAELTYRMHKMIKLTLLNEIVYDNFEESTFHYRAEVLLGVSFIKY